MAERLNVVMEMFPKLSIDVLATTGASGQHNGEFCCLRIQFSLKRILGASSKLSTATYGLLEIVAPTVFILYFYLIFVDEISGPAEL